MKSKSLLYVICFALSIVTKAQTDWPQVYNNPAHTSVTTDEGPDAPVLAWKYQIGTPLTGAGWIYVHTSSPAVVNGKVYVGSTSGNVYCFNAATGGTPLWTRNLTDKVFSSPAVYNGKVYVGTWNDDTYSSALYCLNALNGNIIWTYPVSGMIEMGPTVSDGRVFVAAWYNNEIYCIDATTGTKLWSSFPDDPDYMWGHGGLPAVHDSLVYCNAGKYPPGYSNTKFYAFKEYPSVNTGEVVWVNHQNSEDTHQAMSVGNGRTFGSVDEGLFYCINQYSGQLNWQNTSYPGGAGDPSCISVEGDIIYYGHEKGKVFCRNASTGAILWQSQQLYGHCGVGSVSVTPSRLYVGTGDNGGYASTQSLFCLRKTTGDTLWSYKAGGYITSTPAICNGMAFFTSHDGYLYAVGSWITGIEASIQDNEINVFPNPSGSSTTIRFSNPNGENHTLLIYNIIGQQIQKIENITGAQVITDNKNVEPGLYFFELQSEKGTVGKGKFIKK